MRVIALTLLLVAFAMPARADYDSAVLAYDGGRYEEAIREFRRLSATGHPGAQFMLGAMHFHGRGVVRNDAIAAVWFHKAARQGHPGSQLAFGSIHIRGIGVRQNLSKAYRWLTLAAQSSVATLHQQAVMIRDEAARLMTAAEIHEARVMAEGWSPVSAGYVRRP